MEQAQKLFSYILFGTSISRRERIQHFLSNLFRLSLLIAIAAAAINAHWVVLFVSTLAFAVTLFPAILTRNYHIRLPNEFELFLTIFIYGTLFLGEVKSFYTLFWWWDILLHALSGIAIGFIGFLILYSLYRDSRISASAFSIAVFSFSFSLALGALWEIFEFAMDNIFGLNMQRSGLNDTMWDLIVDSLGAFLTAAIGFVYLKRHDRREAFDTLIAYILKKI